MTIQVVLSPETEAWLAAQAASRCMDIHTYAASLLEQAKNPPATGVQDPIGNSGNRRPTSKGSLAQLFAESPFRGLDMDFERDPDLGRDVAL